MKYNIPLQFAFERSGYYQSVANLEVKSPHTSSSLISGHTYRALIVLMTCNVAYVVWIKTIKQYRAIGKINHNNVTPNVECPCVVCRRMQIRDEIVNGYRCTYAGDGKMWGVVFS